ELTERVVAPAAQHTRVAQHARVLRARGDDDPVGTAAHVLRLRHGIGCVRWKPELSAPVVAPTPELLLVDAAGVLVARCDLRDVRKRQALIARANLLRIA